MDLARFGLTRRPFRPTPDTAAYHATPALEAARAALDAAYAAREGFALVDAAPGLGKTLLALKFLDGLPKEVARGFLPASRFATTRELFQTLLFDHDLPYQGLSDHELRLAVTDQLLTRLSGRGHKAVGPTVIVLDEAQHLTPDALEELRLLSNLETKSTTAVFWLLVAQPPFRQGLRRPELAGFAQRLGTRVGLEPFTAEEADGYLVAQLEHAGADDADELFPAEARRLVAHAAGGVPRLLNQVAAQAFALAGQAGAESVDGEAALEAANHFGLTVPDEADAPISSAGDPAPRPAPGAPTAGSGPRRPRTKSA